MLFPWQKRSIAVISNLKTQVYQSNIAVGAVIAMLAPRLAERFSPVLLVSAGLILLSTGMASLYYLHATADEISVVWRLAICGLGFGLFQSPNMHMIMIAAPLDRSSGASGILAASRLTGQTLGAAMVAFMLTWAAADGVQLSILVASFLALLGAVISSARLLLEIRQLK